MLGRDYRAISGAYDECLDRDGTPRAHWQGFFDRVSAISAREWERRWSEARRQIADNGVTYNVYSDERATTRPWELDPIPFLMPAHEWSRIESGIAQRARLLNAILLDLYGPQTILHRGLIPAEIVLANPGFLRPCHGHLGGGRLLHFHAADLGRAPDGGWRVLTDRAQSPTGAGYAVENRVIISRIHNDIFHDHEVHRLAPFFQERREMIQSCARAGITDPRVVIFTAGTNSKAYFEHSYLARYLGYTLVEGADLTARDAGIFLKTVEGLKPVDVILRRLDDDYCDPLDLRSDSLLGVPGLAECVRAGKVAVLNALGTGLVETPALLPYLDLLCRELLHEELALPSIPTWWCGDPESLEYVLAHLDTLALRPAFGPRGPESVFEDQSAASGREALVRLMLSRPGDFVAQENFTLSTVPVWTGHAVESRHLMLRAQVSARRDSDYSVMPGGLTRVSEISQSMPAAIRSGGGSKDAWILSETPVTAISLLPSHGAPLALRRTGSDIPSRTADNLYWLGRYIERAEGMLHLQRSMLTRLTDESAYEDDPEMSMLFNMLRELMEDQIPAEPKPTAATFENALRLAIFSERSPDSLASTLNLVRQAGRAVRERFSGDSWRILNRLQQTVMPSAEQPAWNEVLAILNDRMLHLSAFSGHAMDSMTRTHGWRFLDVGRRLERVLFTAELLRVGLVLTPGEDPAVLQAILEVADSAMTYRSRYLNTLQASPLLDLLLCDESNPRSAAYQLAAIHEHVEKLPRAGGPTGPAPLRPFALDLLTRVQACDVAQLCTPDSAGRRAKLDTMLTRLIRDLSELSDILTQAYFSHAQLHSRLRTAKRKPAKAR